MENNELNNLNIFLKNNPNINPKNENDFITLLEMYINNNKKYKINYLLNRISNLNNEKQEMSYIQRALRYFFNLLI